MQSHLHWLGELAVEVLAAKHNVQAVGCILSSVNLEHRCQVVMSMSTTCKTGLGQVLMTLLWQCMLVKRAVWSDFTSKSKMS